MQKITNFFRRFLRHTVVQQTTITLFTTLAIQVTSFALLALAPAILPTESFARLTLIVSVTMLASGLFDLGLNLTSTKFYSDAGDEGPFLTAFRLRLACVPLAAMLWILTASQGASTEFGTGLFCGAVLNLWNGIRATDQARQDYRSFSMSSLLFAALRLGFGGISLALTGNPVLTALAMFVLPASAGLLSRSWPLLTGAFRRSGPPAGPMLRYASLVYLNALIFIAFPYLPQFLIAHRLGTTAVGTYGIILTYTAPISLVIYSLRSVLLPKMIGPDKSLENALWSTRGALALTAITLAACLGGLLVGELLGVLYGGRFVGIEAAFAIYFAGFATTAILGTYSVSLHTMGTPQVAIGSALAKAAMLPALLIPLGTSLNRIVGITSVTMVSGELLLIALIAKARYREKHQ